MATLLEFPNTMRFSDVQNIPEDAGYTLEHSKGSHYMFSKKGSRSITIPVHKNSVKIDYLKIIAKTLDLSASETLEVKEEKDEK
jgi:predicted RNA binding protein YcfA (HicA-like mRNA interferase family)